MSRFSRFGCCSAWDYYGRMRLTFWTLPIPCDGHQFFKLVNSIIIRTYTLIYDQNDTISWTDYYYTKVFFIPHLKWRFVFIFFSSIRSFFFVSSRHSESERLTVVLCFDFETLIQFYRFYRRSVILLFRLESKNRPKMSLVALNHSRCFSASRWPTI